MSSGGPAFPLTTTDEHGQPHCDHPGMTLRDYFAAKAMQGILADNTVEAEDDSYEALVDFYKRVAEGSYLMADAMLKQRGVA